MRLLPALRTLPLREAQKLYESKLNLSFTMEEFQHEDWEMIDTNVKCVFVRSRGGSKTQDFTNWIIFRVLRTHEQWCWLACKGGQLQQAMVYVRQNPFVKNVRRETAAKFDVELWTGKIIRFGIISTSNLGLRVDGIVYDEFEDLKPMQELEIYPQMAGMMTHSEIHKTVYLGTLWIKALLNEYVEMYPHKVRPWETLPWLVRSGMIADEIEEGKTPEWEIDMLYRCIPTAPSGLVFPRTEEGRISYTKDEVKYGIDFGGSDVCVGILIRNNICYVVEEYEFQLDVDRSAYDFLKGNQIEVEGTGYNDQEVYGAKSKMMVQRVRAIRVPITNKWKDQRQDIATHFDRIVVDKKACPHTYKDIKSATYGVDGKYFKHPTKSPCHYLDAFLHSINVHSAIVDIPNANPYRRRRARI